MSRPAQEGSLADHLLLIGPLRRRIHIPPIAWAGIAFSLYYIVPLVLAAVEGVAVRPAFGQQMSDYGLSSLGLWASRHEQIAAGRVSPYVNDTTHLMMSLVIAIGTALVLYSLDSFYPTLQSLTSSDILEVPQGDERREERTLERRLHNKFILVVLAAAAAFCGKVLYHNGSAVMSWWGNPAYGPAGLAMAIVGSLGAFYGAHSLYLLAAGQECIAGVLHHPVRLHPFHPDGCNGFSVLGNYLILLFCVCLDGGMATYIVIRLGYLGIQNFPGTWLFAVVFLVSVPFIIIHPLFRATFQIRQAQLRRLATVERLLQPILDRLDQQPPDAETRAALNEELKSLRDLHQLASDIYETSVFPFNVKIGSTLGIGYLLQVFGVAKEIFEKLKK